MELKLYTEYIAHTLCDAAQKQPSDPNSTGNADFPHEPPLVSAGATNTLAPDMGKGGVTLTRETMLRYLSFALFLVRKLQSLGILRVSD
jgi:hypothetical protein